MKPKLRVRAGGCAGVLLALVILLPGRLRAEEGYTVRFNFPLKVGDKYQVTGETKDTTSHTVREDGKVVDTFKENKVWGFKGSMEVQETNELGRLQKVTLTVQSLSMAKGQGGKPEMLLPAGSVVIAERKEARTVYRQQGVEVNPELATALGKFVRVEELEDRAEEAMMGTTKKVKAGDYWAVNWGEVAEAFSKLGFECKKEDVQGRARLTGASDWGVNVAATIKVNNVKMPFPPSPTLKDMKAKESELRFQMTGNLPTDMAALGSGQGRSKMLNASMDYKGEVLAPDGRKFEMDFSYVWSQSLKFTRPK